MSVVVFRKAGLLAAALVGCLCAQSVSAVAENRDQAHAYASKWIGAADQKHRAWAAELIAQYHLEDLYTQLVEQLERSQASSVGAISRAEDELVLEAIADAIIKLQLRVPAREAQKLYPAFPAPAIILLARSSDDNRSVLYSIVTDAKVGEVWLAAADLLAQNPPLGFVAKVLNDFKEFVRILVFAPGAGGGMSYGDCFSSPSPSNLPIPLDWPTIEIYSLQEGIDGGVVVATGKDAISFVGRKTRDGTPWAGKSGCGGLDLQSLRHDLIAQLEGVDPSKLSLRSLVLTDITWKSEEEYKHQITELLQAQAQAFSATVQRLLLLRLLTEEEASHLRLNVELHIIPMDSNRWLPPVPEKALAGILIAR